jgi:rhodanese-related sulfurtransferase
MKKALGQAILLLLLSSGAGVAVHFFHPLAPAWYAVVAPPEQDEVTLEKIQSEWGGQVLWLDARTEVLYSLGHIPGAKLLNEQGFDGQLFDLIEVLQTNDLPVVIYCGGEKCEASRKIKQRLVESLPLENVWVLKGGWPSWLTAGGKQER